MKKIFFLILGHFFFALGIVGAILPILPTTPFLLLAVVFYSRSNSKLHAWLMNNKYFGPSLQEWFNQGIIRTKAKILATIMISFVMIWKIPKVNILIYGKVGIELVLLLLLIFIWTRPSGNQ
jgi:uncharacterized membrane protein YbaN (DUF454 family)